MIFSRCFKEFEMGFMWTDHNVSGSLDAFSLYFCEEKYVQLDVNVFLFDVKSYFLCIMFEN